MNETSGVALGLFVTTAALLSLYRYAADSDPRFGRQLKTFDVRDALGAVLAVALSCVLVLDRGSLAVDVAQAVVNVLSSSDYPVRPRYIRQAVVVLVVLGDFLGVCSFLRRHDSSWDDTGFVCVLGSMATAVMVGLTVDTQALFSASGILDAPVRTEITRIVVWLSVLGAALSLASYTRVLDELTEDIVGVALGLASGALVILAVFHANVVVVPAGADPGTVQAVTVPGWTALAAFLAIGWSVGMVGLVLGMVDHLYGGPSYWPVIGWCFGVVPLIWFVTYQMTTAGLGLFGDQPMVFPDNWYPLTWIPAAIAAVIVWYREID